MLENSDNMLKVLNFLNLSKVAIQTTNDLDVIMDAVGKAYSTAVLTMGDLTSAANTMASFIDKSIQAADLIKRIKQINYYDKLIE